MKRAQTLTKVFMVINWKTFISVDNKFKHPMEDLYEIDVQKVGKYILYKSNVCFHYTTTKKLMKTD